MSYITFPVLVMVMDMPPGEAASLFSWFSPAAATPSPPSPSSSSSLSLTSSDSFLGFPLAAVSGRHAAETGPYLAAACVGSSGGH